jgi:imidazolonepropionase-like amidohydrolase
MPHGEYAVELEFYVKYAGISPLDVIRWATRNGAGLLGMGDEIGTIEAGKIADLLVVNGDPLREHRCAPGSHQAGRGDEGRRVRRVQAGPRHGLESGVTLGTSETGEIVEHPAER